MNGGTDLQQDQKRYAAAVCGKYCSKAAALTSSAPAAETVCCDACLHWHRAGCIKFNEALMTYSTK